MNNNLALNYFPLKQLWDGLAIGQIICRRELSYAQKISVVRFFCNGDGIQNLYPTLTRSGSHWSLLGLAIASDLAAGGCGEYDYEEDFWMPRGGSIYTKLDWRVPLDNFDANIDPAIGSILQSKLGNTTRPFNPVILHTHLPYMRTRLASIRNMRVAVLLRNIYDSMESKYFKHLVLVKQGKMPLELTTQKNLASEEPNEKNDFLFPWDKLLSDTIEFFNSWGNIIARNPSVCLYHYDDMLAEPIATHKSLSDFWNLNLPQECIKEAFHRVNKNEMKKKLPDDQQTANSRVSFRKKSETLPLDRVNYIQEKLEKHLVHDFGYGTTWQKKIHNN